MSEPLANSDPAVAPSDLPDREAFERVYAQIEAGQQLTYEMVGHVFRQPFWLMVVYSFLDAHDAARAIQGAISRLKKGKK